MNVVFHCATAAPAAANTANRKLMHDVNVLGTRHLLDACAAAGVRRLVYTSSASVRRPSPCVQGGGPSAWQWVQNTGPKKRTRRHSSISAIIHVLRLRAPPGSFAPSLSKEVPLHDAECKSKCRSRGLKTSAQIRPLSSCG